MGTRPHQLLVARLTSAPRRSHRLGVVVGSTTGWARLAIVAATLAASAVCVVASDDVPKGKPERVADCLEERFLEVAGPFQAVHVPSGATPALIPADDHCLEGDPSACANRERLDRTRAWYAGARAGAWVCVTDGRSYGWTPRAEVELGPLPAAQPEEWLGRWRREAGSAELRIGHAPGGLALHVEGQAEWQAHPDSPAHGGDLDHDAKLQGNLLELGDPRCIDRQSASAGDCYDCAARLMLIAGRLLVVDNHNCGGMNVNFDGLYERAPGAGPQGHPR